MTASAPSALPWPARLWRFAFPYLLIAPTLLFVVLFTLYPAVKTIQDSFYEPARKASDPAVYVGLQNYIDLFDPAHYLGSRFTRVLVNTLVFSFGTVVFSVPLALLMAILLNRKMRGLGFWRFSVFYPALLPMLGAASLWAFLYSNQIGLINTVLRGFGLRDINWLGDPNTVLASIILVNVWKQSGYFMLFYLAGLQNIPRDLYEAADLDGANLWQQFRYLTLPLLRRSTLFVLIIALTFAFQTVEQLQALNQGNPADRGNLMLYFIYQNIQERRNWGYVNAMTVILVGILLIFTVTNLIISERREARE
jgi:sn-glycerol 3-phosphate transport system permease protein